MSYPIEINYTRDEVDYNRFFSKRSKELAKHHTESELETMAHSLDGTVKQGVKANHNAIKRTHSMTSNSQARAQSSNIVSAYGEELMDVKGAIIIHRLFPEHGKQGTK